MKIEKAKKYFLAAIFVPFLNLPVHSQTALEQITSFSPATDFSVPAVTIERAVTPLQTWYGPFTSAGKAQEKLAYFNYNKADALSFERIPEKRHKEFTTETIKLRIADPAAAGGEYIQEYFYYRTNQAGPRPTVVLPMHFMGSKSVTDLASVHFAKNGYNAIIIIPQGSLTDQSRPLVKINDLLQQEVVAGRMCVDMLEKFPEVDAEKIYAFGISMGGIRTALLFGVESRFKKAGEVAGGGDLPGVVADTNFSSLKKVRDARMKAENLATVADFRTYFTSVMKFDPLDFASLRRPEDILLVIGTHDNFVPDLYQEKLYQAFSRPEEGRYPRTIRTGHGHLITAFTYREHIDRIIKFFEGEN